MHEQRLLERIENYSETGERNIDISESALIDSITNHLRAMLNVRQGSVMARKDYGLADINDVTSNHREALKIIRNSIQYCIEQFEPRLTNVVVDHYADDERPLELRFDIKGEVSYADKTTNVWLETIVNPTGHVVVN